MKELAEIFEDARGVFAFVDGESPTSRAYRCLEDHSVFKPYDETATLCAVKHMIGRAWDGGPGAGHDELDLEEVNTALDALISAVDHLMPVEEDGE